jgi:hypothetical protein
MFNGGEIDADLAGGIALLVAAAAVIGASLLIRSGRASAKAGFSAKRS